MSKQNFAPFAVRFIGFSPAQADIIEDNFRRRNGTGKLRYERLPPDSLHDPDLFLVNALNTGTPAALACLGASPARPALLLGPAQAEVALPCFAGRLDAAALLHELDKLIWQRAEVLSQLPASDVVIVPERRRPGRHGVRAIDANALQRLRRTPMHGGVLVVDHDPAFGNQIAARLGRRNVVVERAHDEKTACTLCAHHKIAVVIINTDTPRLDPYRLCALIKAQPGVLAAVIFLVGETFIYDQEQARRAGCDGFLNTPLTPAHVTSLLKRFIPHQRTA